MSDKVLTKESAKWLADAEKKKKFINWYETVEYTYDAGGGTVIRGVCTVPGWKRRKLIDTRQKLLKKDKITLKDLNDFEEAVREDAENQRCGEESD